MLNGYRFTSFISGVGDCLYLHPKLKNFQQQMDKRFNFDNKPWGWGGPAHRFKYLRYPKWNGTYYPIHFIEEKHRYEIIKN